MSMFESGEDDREDYEQEALAHRQLANDLVVALGLLGPTSSYREIFSLLPEDSKQTFKKEAYANRQYEIRGDEMASLYLKGGASPYPIVPVIESQDGKYTLNAVGQHHFEKIMAEFESNPSSHPHIEQMMAAAIEAETRDSLD